MLEHENEYIVGGGLRSAEYTVDFGGLLASAHGVGIKGGEYIIGGRLSLPAAMTALQDLRRALAATVARRPPTAPARVPPS